MRTSIPHVLDSYRREYTIERCDADSPDGGGSCERGRDPNYIENLGGIHRMPHTRATSDFKDTVFWDDDGNLWKGKDRADTDEARTG